MLNVKDVSAFKIVNVNVDLSLAPAGNFSINLPSFSFLPDIAIVNEIAYSALLLAGNAPDNKIYTLYSDLADGLSPIGSFGNVICPVDAVIDTTTGSFSNPGTVFFIARPTQSINFQIKEASITVLGELLNGAPAGNLSLTISFYRLK